MDPAVQNTQDVTQLFRQGSQKNASDIFLIPGAPITYKVGEKQERCGEMLTPKVTNKIISDIYDLAHREHRYEAGMSVDDDFSVGIAGVGRFRLNVYHQRNTLAAVIRIIQFGLPDPAKLNIPEEVLQVADLHQGLVLVCGPTGTGKSTTLACIIDRINSTHPGHIVTVENPIEYIHNHKKCLVSQREIGTDVDSYEQALTSALREDPDIIMFGEMRTQSVIDVAMRAAETGQLMFSSLHTLGAAATITRIIDTYQAEQQNQARTQISQVLEAIISQKLIPDKKGKLIPVFEIMYSNPAIRNLIRENKIHQIDSIIQASSAEGMRTYDGDLLRLYRKGLFTREVVLGNCLNIETVTRQL